MIQEYLGKLRGDLLSPQQSLAARTYCLWMGTAQGNGPLTKAHLDPIPAKRVVHKEMVSGNVPMGRTCSSFLSWAQLLNCLLWPCSSAFTNDRLLQPKNDFTQVKQPQTSQRRTVPRGWVGEGSPYTKVMVSDLSSALCHQCHRCFPRNSSLSKITSLHLFWFPLHPLAIYPAWAQMPRSG